MENAKTSSVAADEVGMKMGVISLGEAPKMTESTHSQAERDEAPEAMECRKDYDGFEDLAGVTNNQISNSLARIHDLAQNKELGMEANAQDHAPELAATSIVRDKVLSVNEILTNILVHLPSKNIFGVQRVSKSFLNAIQKSPEIQEKLFLRQRKVVKNVPEEGAETTQLELTVNPLLFEEYGIGKGIGVLSLFVAIESSIFDTYPLDVPCGEIDFELRVGDGTGQAISIITKIVDTGGTMRELMELLFSRKMDLIVHDKQHRGWCYDCSPNEIIRQWQQADGWRNTLYPEPMIWIKKSELIDRIVWIGMDHDSEEDDESEESE